MSNSPKMAESVAELAEEVITVDQPPPQLLNPNRTHRTSEELVAKAIAPVKREFLRPPPSRTTQNDTAVSDAADAKVSQSTVVAKEKKSKRQHKRERRQKSTLHLCSMMAKSGDVSSCSYGEKCRFSHDIEAFKAQKPADLAGKCPFMTKEGHCPYGLTCRFYGTHEDGDTAAVNNSLNVQKKNSEINGLNKDVQKLLWKNKMKFPKANATLKSLGLLVINNGIPVSLCFFIFSFLGLLM